MKLYATTTSNRATKGQGGDYLLIDVFNEDKMKIIEGDIHFEGDDLHIYITTTIGDDDQCIDYVTKIKGKQQRIYSLTDKVDDREIDYDIEQEHKANQKKDEECRCGASELPTVHTKRDCKNPY